jgi:hypothetical protein
LRSRPGRAATRDKAGAWLSAAGALASILSALGLDVVRPFRQAPVLGEVPTGIELGRAAAQRVLDAADSSSTQKWAPRSRDS